jgi:hypothetical protein
MNSHVRRFYRKYTDEETPIRFYHEVIALHENPRISWEEIKRKVPSLPKAWYELALLVPKDRLDFVREFWLSTLPFVSHIHAFLDNFFNKLDDIGIYLIQPRFDSPFECEIVYSLRDDTSFFHGFPPAEESLENLQREFNDVLPKDYMTFLKIHDGFSKHSDTGFIKSRNLRSVYENLQEKIQDDIIYSGKQAIEARDLIPFYESFGEPSFQCFYLNWTPVNSIGNVFYSMAEGKISDVHDPNSWNENLAFPTFLDWLVFYLEGIEE